MILTLYTNSIRLHLTARVTHRIQPIEKEPRAGLKAHSGFRHTTLLRTDSVGKLQHVSTAVIRTVSDLSGRRWCTRGMCVHSTSSDPR